jgi:hypothetical protein
MSEFTLSNDPPKPRKQPLLAPPPGKQLMLLGGLDCPEGTQNLFDVDGPSKLLRECPPVADVDPERVAWCPECRAFTKQVALDCGPWECEGCANAPSIDEVADWLIEELNAGLAEMNEGNSDGPV